MDDRLSFLPLIVVATEVVWLDAVLLMWEKWQYEKKTEAGHSPRNALTTSGFLRCLRNVKHTLPFLKA